MPGLPRSGQCAEEEEDAGWQLLKNVLLRLFHGTVVQRPVPVPRSRCVCFRCFLGNTVLLSCGLAGWNPQPPQGQHPLLPPGRWEARFAVPLPCRCWGHPALLRTVQLHVGVDVVAAAPPPGAADGLSFPPSSSYSARGGPGREGAGRLPGILPAPFVSQGIGIPRRCQMAEGTRGEQRAGAGQARGGGCALGGGGSCLSTHPFPQG